MTEQPATKELDFKIPTVEGFLREPEPFLGKVSDFLDENRGHGALMYYKKEIGLKSNVEPDELLEGKLVLVDTPFVKPPQFLFHGRQTPFKFQLLVKRVATRIAFEGIRLRAGENESGNIVGKDFHRKLFDFGFPVQVGRLRQGPAYRKYALIAGGNLPVSFIEGEEKYLLSEKSDKKISNLDDNAIVVKDSEGVVRAWLPPA